MTDPRYETSSRDGLEMAHRESSLTFALDETFHFARTRHAHTKLTILCSTSVLQVERVQPETRATRSPSNGAREGVGKRPNASFSLTRPDLEEKLRFTSSSPASPPLVIFYPEPSKRKKAFRFLCLPSPSPPSLSLPSVANSLSLFSTSLSPSVFNLSSQTPTRPPPSFSRHHYLPSLHLTRQTQPLAFLLPPRRSA